MCVGLSHKWNIYVAFLSQSSEMDAGGKRKKIRRIIAIVNNHQLWLLAKNQIRLSQYIHSTLKPDIGRETNAPNTK